MANLILKEINQNFPDLDKVHELNNRAFPKEERIENEKLLTIVERCNARALAIYDQDLFVGFVIGAYSSKYEIYYIWFFAIEESLRSQGYGTKALQAIAQRHEKAQMVIEIEVLDPESENYEERLRRYAFYQRSGFEKSNWSVAYFGAEFQIITRPAPFRKEDYETFWNELWQTKAPKLYPLKDFSK